MSSTSFFRQEVDAAVDELLAQQVILYPTDTVWGLGCDAEVPRAVEKLYKLKGRAEGTPSIVLVADLEMLRRYAAEVSPELEAALVAQTRPTTYIVPASRALALVRGRDYVLPQDVLDITADVLRHRLVLSYDALADGVPADHVVKRIVQSVPLPQVSPRQRAGGFGPGSPGGPQVPQGPWGGPQQGPPQLGPQQGPQGPQQQGPQSA